MPKRMTADGLIYKESHNLLGTAKYCEWSREVEDGHALSLMSCFMALVQLELLDPALDMSIGAPPPKRIAAPKLRSAEALEQLKPDIMRTLGMDPDDEQAWAATVDGIVDEVDALGITSTPDAWVRTLLEIFLGTIRDK